MISNIEDMVIFLREFHRSWLREPSLDSATIPSDFPPGFARIYREFGALIELDETANGFRTPFSAQDGLMKLGMLKRIEGMIEFAWENQGNWSCRFPLGEDDPVVYSNARDVWQEPQRGFQIVCDSLNHFLTTICLQEAVMSCPVLIAIRGMPTVEDVLSTPSEPLWLNGHYVDGEPSHDFYWIADKDILIMRHAGMWLASHNDSVESLINVNIEYKRLH